MRFHGRVEVSFEDGLATLRLSRAAERNAIDSEMAIALRDAASHLSALEGLRCLLILAEGDHFTVGGDIRTMAASDDLPALLGELVGTFNEAIWSLASAQVPVVAAIQGAGAGGGLGIALAADFVLVSDDAKFALGFAEIGLSPDGGTSWFLPRLVGVRRAAELLMGGRVLNADEALEWGLVSRVTSRSDLEAEATTLARRLAAGATHSLVSIRNLLRTTWETPLQERLLAERDGMVSAGGSADAREGITAFSERRPPEFRGS